MLRVRMRKKARADQSPEGTSLNIAFVERQKAMRTMARSWKSKMGCYEIPCAVTGDAAKAERRLRGNTYQHPYDRTVGTWKTGDAEKTAARRGGWKTITILYPGESGGTVLMKQAHKPVEGRPPVGNSSLIFDRAPCAVKAARTVLSGGKSGEKQLSKDYLSQSGAKSQGIKQFMAGAGVAIIGLTLVPLLNNLFTIT